MFLLALRLLSGRSLQRFDHRRCSTPQGSRMGGAFVRGSGIVIEERKGVLLSIVAQGNFVECRTCASLRTRSSYGVEVERCGREARRKEKGKTLREV